MFVFFQVVYCAIVIDITLFLKGDSTVHIFVYSTPDSKIQLEGTTASTVDSDEILLYTDSFNIDGGGKHIDLTNSFNSNETVQYNIDVYNFPLFLACSLIDQINSMKYSNSNITGGGIRHSFTSTGHFNIFLNYGGLKRRKILGILNKISLP